MEACMRRSNMLSELGSTALNVTVPRELKERLLEEAVRSGMNVSAYVRKLIEIGRRETQDGEGR